MSDFAGGFMTGSPSGSQGSPGGTRKAGSHTLRPITIKQAGDAQSQHADSELSIDGVEVGQVTLVAQVVSITVQTTNSVFFLDDGTGRIEARLWVDTSVEDSVTSGDYGKEGQYVRVTGVLKLFSNKRYVNATHIRPSTDPHELYFHLYEAMYVTMVLKRGPPNKLGGGAAANGDVPMSDYTATTTVGGGSDQYAGLPPLHRRILEFIKVQPEATEGVHVAKVAREIREEAEKISDALDKLMDDGYVFTTLDESHFACSN